MSKNSDRSERNRGSAEGRTGENRSGGRDAVSRIPERRLRIHRRSLACIAVLMAASLIAAVFIIPGLGKSVKEYRANRADLRAAEAELSEARAENEKLGGRLEELKTMDKDTEAARAKVFELAAALEQDIRDGKTDKRICYITLDDGPYNKGREFLKLFGKYDIKATFFLTTANGDRLPDQGDLSAASMYPEYIKYGHTIGNHTYTHDYYSGGVYENAKSFMKAVEAQEEFTEKAAGGYRPEIVRFPGGTSMAGSSLGSIEKALRKKGYVWIDWTVDSGDSWGTDEVTPELISKNIMAAAKDQKIMVILMHEWSQNSLDALPDIIEKLGKKGYIFLPLFPGSCMVER